MSTFSVDAARPALPNAVTAFLRGIERRALVLAELQAGGAERGDAAVAATARMVGARIAGEPLAQWPHAFWSTLLASPLLRGAPVTAGATDWSGLAAGPRAALLLRLAAGLDEAEAARVLGVGLPAYRLALQRAVDQVGGARALEVLYGQLHERVEALSPERVRGLATVAPATPAAAEPGPAAAAAGPRAPRWVLRVLWALLALCVVAFAATFRSPGTTQARVQGDARVEALPAPAAPAARYRPESALLVHRDFALLVDTAAAPLLADLEFYSWLAAGAAAAAADDVTIGGGAALPPAVDPAGASELETVDAPL